MRYFKHSKLKLLLKRIQQNFIACVLTRKKKFQVVLLSQDVSSLFCLFYCPHLRRAFSLLLLFVINWRNCTGCTGSWTLSKQYDCDQPKLSQQSTIDTDLWDTDQATADCKILFWNSSDSTCSTVRSDKPSWSSWKKKCLRQLSLHFLGPSKITIQFKRYPNLIL